MKLAYLTLVVVLGGACAADPLGIRAGANAGEPPARTNALEYALQHQPGIYTVRMSAVYRNLTSRTVYLQRRCGYGEAPERQLVRADGDTMPLWLSEGVCITAPDRDPIPLPPGESHADEFVLMSTESPAANPPITMAMRTGAFRLVYLVTTRPDGWRAADVLPLERRVSNVFRVLPPEQ